jgi:hypothetical protein
MKHILFFLFFIPSVIFAQGNFNVEWEGPAGSYYNSIINGESNNSIPEIVLTTSTTISVYDGATHQLKYSYSNPDSGFYHNTNVLNEQPMDFNSDGIFDFIIYKVVYSGSSYSTTIRVINGATGSIVFQNNYIGYMYPYTFDIDGDGFVEICLTNMHIGTDASTFKIISTPAHTIGVNENTEHLKDYNLKQNYPNPFNPTTNIEYSIKENANVKILVFDILGREIRTVLNEFKKAGTYSLMFDGSALPSGTYFYQLIVNDIPEIKKMLLIK